MGESGATINQRNPLVFGLKVFGIGFGLLVFGSFVIFAIATFSRSITTVAIIEPYGLSIFGSLGR